MVSTMILIVLSALVIAQGQASGEQDNSCDWQGFKVQHNEYAHVANCSIFNVCVNGKFHIVQRIGCTLNAECHPNEYTCKCKAGYVAASTAGYITQCKPAPDSCILGGTKVIKHNGFAHTDNCTIQKTCYQGFLVQLFFAGCPAYSKCSAAEYTCKCDEGFLPNTHDDWLASCEPISHNTTIAAPTNPPTTAGTGHQSSPAPPPNSCILEGGKVIEHNRYAHSQNCTLRQVCSAGSLLSLNAIGCPANSQCNAAEYTCKCDEGFLPNTNINWLASCEPIPYNTTVAAPTNPPTTAGTGHQSSPVAPPNSCTIKGGKVIKHKGYAHVNNCTVIKTCDRGNLSYPRNIGCPANSKCIASEYTCKCGDGFLTNGPINWVRSCTPITTDPAPTNPPHTTAAPTNPPPTTAAPTNPPAVQKSCPDMTWTKLDGNVCVKVFSQDKKTWEDARGVCQGYGGDLVKIVDEKHTNVITGLLIKPFRYWIGIRDDDQTGTWLYSDKTALTSYRPWAYKEPNNRGGNEFCVEMISNGRGSWNDKRCSRRNRYVCQTSNQAVMSR